MPVLMPESAEELAALLRDHAQQGHSISIAGHNSKRLMAGPIAPADVAISTSKLRRVLQYEPRDLTISVQTGMPFRELQALLAANGQMVALDPPFEADATVGGVIAADMSGPMRRAYGTARDLVIGMSFAMLDGALVRTGGMVVKNVAGLDMGKLMIGSFGTLAAITNVNFRLHSLPEAKRTFLFRSPGLEDAMETRKRILRGILRLYAVDLLSPPSAARFEHPGFCLAVRAAGTEALLKRYDREMQDAERLSGAEDANFWEHVRECTPEYLAQHPLGVILQISTKLKEIEALLRFVPGPFVCRAASGVTYAYFESWNDATALIRVAAENGWPAVVEFAPQDVRESQELWPLQSQGPKREAFAMMEKVKHLFDPNRLLNRNRLYGRI